MSKPTIRQSNFQNYLKCPRAFKLSLEHEIKQTKSMDTGKIFEYLVFGFKSEEQKQELILTKQGKMKADFINLEPIAETVRSKYFGEVKAHTRISCDMGEYELTGEIDVIGEIKVIKELVDGLADLKYCADVPKIWDYKQNKADFFQAVSYPYIYWKKYGVVKPFYYVVVDKSGHVRVIKVNYDWKIAFAWYESVLEMAYNDSIYEPNYDECKGHGKFDPRCKYLDFCMFGIDLVFGYEEIEFMELQDSLEIQVNESKQFNQVDNRKPKEFNPDKIENPDELEESNLDQLINTGSATPLKSFTYYEDELKDGLCVCRGCRTRSIEKGSEECPNCHTKVVWI